MAEFLQKKRSYVKYVHVVIMFALILFVRYIPPVGAITPLGMQALGIFAGIVYGWSTLGMIFPSLIGILAFGFLGENTVVATLSTAFGDKLTVIMLTFLLVASLVDQVGLSEYIAKWCISRKFVEGRPWAIAIMFCVAGAIISATVNVYASMILMWNVFYSFCDQVGFKKGDKYPMLVLMAILFCCTVAAGIFPYMGLSILVVAQLQKYAGMDINYFLFTVVQLFMVLFSSIIYFLILKYVFRPDVTPLLNKENTQVKQELASLTGHQKLVGGLIILLMLMLFLPGLLPTSIPIIGFFKSLDIAGVAAAILILYYILMLGHKDVIPIQQLAKGLSWEMIFMFATVAPLSAAINNPDCGILAFVGQSIGGVLGGMSPYVFIVALIVIASIITQFANNAVIMMVIGPIMFSFGDIVGADPLVLTVIASFCLNLAFVTPAASGPAAMAFSNQEWIGTKNAYIHGVIIFCINILTLLISIPIAEMIF